MAKKAANPCAFPRTIIQLDDGSVLGLEETGMSLRDYFAAKAMQALIGRNEGYETASAMAYKFADAMMKARK